MGHVSSFWHPNSLGFSGSEQVSSNMADDLDSTRVHVSITQKIMVLGVPMDAIAMLGFVLVIFVGIAGFSLLTIFLTIVVLALAFPLLRMLFAKEPFAGEILGSYLMTWKDRMPHHGKEGRSPSSDPVMKNMLQ